MAIIESIIMIIIKINVAEENNFMLLFSTSLEFFGESVTNLRKIAGITSDFFVLFFSLGDIAAVYINNVIIPEENVRMVTSASHLDITTLKIPIAVMIEIANSSVAIAIGFNVVTIIIAITKGAIDIFLFTFDLQNQCSF